MLIQPPPPAWPLPTTSVFVAGVPRCGSTLLCKAMAETGLLGNPEEHFNLNWMLTRFDNPELSFVHCCRFAVDDSTSADGIFATKVFWYQFSGLREAVPVNDWFPNQRWIVLLRNDMLGQAISWLIALQTHQWNTDFIGEPVTPKYSRHELKTRIDTISLQLRQWNDFFAQNKIQPLVLQYEKLENDIPGTVAEVARFVGGGALEEQVRCSEPFTNGRFEIGIRKQRDARNEDWRRRFLGGD